MLTTQQKHDALMEISRACGVKGYPTGEMIVKAVRGNPKHVLYDQFNWDKEKAAFRDLVRQADRLVARIKVDWFYTEKTFRGKSVIHFSKSEPMKFGSKKISVRDAIRDPRLPDHEAGRIDREELMKSPISVQKKALEYRAKMIAGHIASAREIAFTLNLSDYFEELLSQAVGGESSKEEAA